MTTGERIKQRRKELGMSADELADAIGVHRTTIFRYEKGDIEKIPLTQIVPIARALRTTAGYLAGWEENTLAEEELDKGEEEVMRLFESFSETQKFEALNYLRYLAFHGGKKET